MVLHNCADANRCPLTIHLRILLCLFTSRFANITGKMEKPKKNVGEIKKISLLELYRGKYQAFSIAYQSIPTIPAQ